MKERAREAKASASREESLQQLLTKIGEMQPSDRALAERFHAIVAKNAPELEATTWYGMPAYSKGGGIVCHFQPAEKFKTRYATIGFSDKAGLDDGGCWPVAYALKTMGAAEERRIAELVKKAVG